MSAAAQVQPSPQRSPPKRGPRCGLNRQSSLTQALDLKDQAYRDGTADSTPVHIKAALMRAWVDLQEMVMAIRGEGKPKPVEARNATPKRKPSATTPVVYPGPSDASQAAVVSDKPTV